MRASVVLWCSLLILVGYANPGLSAEQKRTFLEPSEKYSFCTIVGAGYTLGYVGDDWALELYFPSKSDSTHVKAESAIFKRGPDIHRYVRRSGGPPIPRLPNTGEYYNDAPVGVSIDIKKININANQNYGVVVATVNDFSVKGQFYYLPEKITLHCKVPYP